MRLKTTVAFELRKVTATTSGPITSFYTLRTSRNKNSHYVRREVTVFSLIPFKRMCLCGKHLSFL